MLFLLGVTAVSISDISYHQRIDNLDVGCIIRCSFVNLYESDSGAAICISSPSSFSLLIDNTCFTSCVTISKGGCIYFVSNNLQIIGSDFELCFICKSEDELLGNSVHAVSPAIQLNKTAYHKCGPKASISADSGLYLKTSNIQINSMNNTMCCSTGGPSSFCIDGLTNTIGNNAIFMNVVNGTAIHCISIYPNPLTLEVRNSNFIDIIVSSWLFASYGLMQIFNSYITSNTTLDIINSRDKVKFSNCWGNIQYVTSSYGSIPLDENNVGFCGKQIDFCFSESDRSCVGITVTILILSLGLN